MDSRRKMQGVRAGHRPERRSAGTYSIHDDNRVERIKPGPGPGGEKRPASDLTPPPRRRMATSDAIARVQLRPNETDTPLPHNDVDAPSKSNERVTAPHAAPPASGRPQLRTRQMEEGWEKSAFGDESTASLKDSLPDMTLPKASPEGGPPTAKSKAPAPQAERPTVASEPDELQRAAMARPSRPNARATLPAPAPAEGALAEPLPLGTPRAPVVPGPQNLAATVALEPDEAADAGNLDPGATLALEPDDETAAPMATLAFDRARGSSAEDPAVEADASPGAPSGSPPSPRQERNLLDYEEPATGEHVRPAPEPLDLLPEPAPLTTARAADPPPAQVSSRPPRRPPGRAPRATERDQPPIMSTPAPATSSPAPATSSPAPVAPEAKARTADVPSLRANRPAVEPPLPRSRSEAERELFLGLEEAISRGDWSAVHEEAGAPAAEPDADPALVLVDALACRELAQGREADAAHQQRAIRAMERLLQLDDESPVALLLAKRMLRRSPSFAQEQPKAPLSVAVLFAGLALGGGAGWLVTRLLF